MRKLFKKSIACVLAAILCVSLCVCAIPASAEAITFSTNAVSAKAGDAVTIDFEIADFAAVKAAQIKLVLPEAIASIDSVSLNGDALVATEDVFEIGEGYVKLQALFGDSEYDDFAAADSLVLSIAATVADVEAGTYAYGDAVVNLYSETAALEVDGAFGEFKVVEDAPVVIEPELDSKLAIMLRSASVQDTLGIGYVISNATFAKYDHITVEVVAQKYDGNYNVVTAEAIEIPVAQLNASLSNATYTGIAMYALDLSVSAKIKAYDAEGNYVAYSQTYTDTPVALLKSTYATSKDDNFKKMVTDMFNLATKAQEYFGNASANKENELLAKFNTNPINKDWDQTYASTEMPELNLVNSVTWAEGAPLTSSDLTFMPSLNYAATPTLGYLIIDKKNKFTSADLKLDVSYTTVCPSAFAGLKTQTFEGEGFTSVGTYETAAFSKMTLADSNQVITAKLYYKGELVLTSEYTVEQGVNSSPAGSKPLGEALAKFEAAARAYFGA